MTTFWTLWTFNALMALIPVYFFLAGLADGTVSSKNMMLWLMILLVVAIVVGGTLILKSSNQLAIAKTILVLAAIPGLIAVIFYGIIIIGKPKWN